MRTLIIIISAAGAIASSTFAAETGYYSQPALHGSTLVFVSEGDLWTATLPEALADHPTIIAHRLTSGDGDESRPQISPDGKSIAFTAQYEGNADVYVMPIDGGSPRRLTFHPGPELAAGWTADGGSVLMVSPVMNHFGRLELYRVSLTSGMPERYGFGECSMISMSSTGRRFAFTRWSNENWTWKHYRGGTAPDIWLGEIDAGAFKPLTLDRSNDMFPMWIGGRIYFTSDRAGVSNIFSVSPDAGEADIKQHTQFAADAKNPTAIEGYDARWPAMDLKKGAQRIVFCQGGGLGLLNLADDKVQRLNVQIASDRVLARRRFAPVNETMTEFDLSPDGKKLIIGSRGELLVADVDTKAITQLTRDALTREWGGVFIDKNRIALISDAGGAGEQQIAAMPIDGSAPPRSATRDREAWLFPPVASPDGKLLAFADKTLRLHVLDLTTFEHRQIDQSEAGEMTEYRFSPDSQWLAYTKPMPNGMRSVFIASVRTGRTFPVSVALSDDSEPCWDPKGKYLYMMSERSINPVLGSLDLEHTLLNTTMIVAVALASDTPPPDKKMMLAAKIDVEDWAKPPEPPKPEKKDDAKGAKPAEPAEDEAPPVDPNAPPKGAIRVDTDNLSQRQFILPIPAGNYTGLEAVAGAVLFISHPLQGLLDDSWPNPPQPRGALKRFDILEGESKDLAQPLSAFAISADGSTIAYMEMNDEGKPARIKVVPSSGEGAGGGGGEGTKKDKGVIDLAGQQLRVDIPSEWKQILGEAWRLQRDFFWAPNMVGLDWPAMRTKYQALLPRIGTRAELNDVIGQMIGELGNSHSYIFGGQPAREVKGVGVGLLGADIVVDGGGHRIARIIPGQPWPGGYTSPLAEPSLNVKEGAYIRAVNGVELAAGANIYDLLQDQAGKMVRLTISDDGGAATRDVQVKTIPSEQKIRYAAWVEANRKSVEEKSGGRIGYLHIPDMGGDGLMMFSRYFYPQFDKPALVIDVRENGGGFVSQMVLERLGRKVLAFDQPRHGIASRYPLRAVNAHMITLIDQHAGSDGDIFPSMFRKMGLGPLLGMRTWGGVVGIRGDKAFVDMGLSTQPEFAWWESEGGWVIENVGVEPDIELDATPADRAAGRDPQLDKAIEYLLKKLEDSPITQPPLPAWPVRTGK